MSRFLASSVVLATIVLFPGQGLAGEATSTPARQEIQSPPQEYRLSDVAMTLHRTTCYGTCPDYTLTIRGDGQCTFSLAGGPGWNASKDTVYAVSQQETIELLKQFYDLDFFALRSAYTTRKSPCVQPDGVVHECESMTVDDPHAFLTLKIGSYLKTVERNYVYGPKGLKEIADRMDRVGESDVRLKERRPLR